MARHRAKIQQQQLSDDDWAYQDLKRDIEADGSRRVVEITDLDNNVPFNSNLI